MNETTAGRSPGRIRIGRQQGRRALLVGDVAQSIEVRPEEPTPGYWPEMLPPALGDRALLLGLGGGTIAHLLLASSPTIEIVAVDDNEAILAAAREHPRFRLPDERVHIVTGDAFAVARDLADRGERFDYVAVDLYRGSEIVRGSLARPFLRRVGALLSEDGVAAFNLPRDRQTARRLRRVGQHLALLKTTLIGLNCVVHCRRL